MRSKFLLPLLLTSLSIQAQVLNQKSVASRSSPLQPEPIRAAQISSLDFENRGQLARFFKNLKSAGINTVIVRVFQNPKDGFHKLCAPAAETGYYFKTNSAPVVCDLVGTIAEEAHAADLKFYAWMNSRYADYGIENRTDLHSRGYDFASKKYRPSPGLCIFHPEVRARLFSLFEDLACYPVDGVLVQDDLMMKHNEDFHPLAVRDYLRERGKAASPSAFYQKVEFRGDKVLVGKYTNDFREWTQWKASKLLELADGLRESLRSKNPGIKFGFNFYYETGLKPGQALEWFSQDVKLAAARNYDFYSLMLYHRQIADELKLDDQELDSAVASAAGNFISAVNSPCAALIKLMTKDFKTGESIPEGELKRIIGKIPERSHAGVAFFTVSAGMEKEVSNLISNWEKGDEKTYYRRPSDRADSSRQLQAEKR